jgi:hypothetical protein
MKKKPSDIIPSKNALKYCAYQLRKMQYGAMKDAIVLERAEMKPEAKSLLEQADDLRQVAEFLEARIL